MKKKWGLILSFICATISITAQNFDEWAYHPDEEVMLEEQQVISPLAGEIKSIVTKTKKKSRELINRSLSALGIKPEEVSRATQKIKLLFLTIKKDIDELQRVAQVQTGPIAKLQKIISTIYDLKQEIVAQSSQIRSIFIALPIINSLIVQVDELQLNPLLNPLRKTLLSFASLFSQIISIYNNLGKFGPMLLSPGSIIYINNGISDLRHLADNLTEIIQGGKRILKNARLEMITTLIYYRSNLAPLAEKLSKLEGEVLPRMTAFLSNLSSIANTIISLTSISTDIPGHLRKAIDERRKKTLTGIVGPRIRFMEIKKIILQLRSYIDLLVENVASAIGSITDVVDITIESIIKGIKNNLNFNLLKERSYRGAVNLPSNARSLHRNVEQLIESIIASQENIGTQEEIIEEIAEPLLAF